MIDPKDLPKTEEELAEYIKTHGIRVKQSPKARHTGKSKTHTNRDVKTNNGIYKSLNLTPAQKTFADVYAQTDSGIEAVRRAYPLLAQSSTIGTLYNKAHRLLRNANILAEIADRTKLMEYNANKATLRLSQLIDTTDETVALNATKFAIEQVEGKATQRIETKSQSIQLNIDLTGEGAPQTDQ